MLNYFGIAAISWFSWSIIKWFPSIMLTPEVCLAAVRKDGFSLIYIPYELRTPEMCLAAVESGGHIIMYVPEKLKTPEICLAAVKHVGEALLFVPDELKTPELCLEAVRCDGYAIRYVPDELTTSEMCLAAVKNYGWALAYVPADKQTPKIIAAAIANNPEAAQFIKNKMVVQYGEPKKMPPNAFDTLEMGYDEQSAIQDGELMVDFHDEFKFERFYRAKTFKRLILPSRKNPMTGTAIAEYTIYQAVV